jgi:hypothetical protein
MEKYRIVAARPKSASNHLNSQFKLFRYDGENSIWSFAGWKSIGDVSDLLRSGHEVRTGKITDGKMSHGAAVELELRIAKNGTVYKIGDMPDM